MRVGSDYTLMSEYYVVKIQCFSGEDNESMVGYLKDSSESF